MTFCKIIKVTAVIPAYNEASRILHTITQVKPLVDEIIVVDDASTDSTAAIAREQGAKVLTQAKNKGYIEAIKYGFREAAGDIVVTIDADGEFSTQEFPDLLKPIIDGHADMVQGRRDIIPRPSERAITWLAQRKTNVGDSGTGLRAIRTELAKTLAIKGACICGVLSLEVAAKGGRIAEIPITLQRITKPRKIAWFHLRQFFYLLPWFFKNFDKRISQPVTAD
jgi:glycosyltransferase involved in cell wall biosynthesis